MSSKRGRGLTVLASAAVLMGLFIASGAFQVASANTGNASYNNVQVFLQTAKSNVNYSYTITAYDSSGSTIATSQTPFPAASFELPSGSYTFTAIASETSQFTNVCYGVAQAKQGYGAPVVGAATSNAMRPVCGGGYPAAEYGFSVQQVSGPSTLNIQTSAMDSLPLSTYSIQVRYANGTAASGVQVSSTILGANYWWPSSGKAAMWNQTGKDGTTTLVAPSAPLMVTAWSWVPVNIPKSETTVQTTVGGEKVNVTVYWEPMYVGLAGSVVLMPPTTSTKIALHAQQPNYWVQSYGVNSAGTASSAAVGQGTVASAQSGVPASVAPQFGGAVQGPLQLSIPTTTVTSTAATGGGSGLGSYLNWLIAGVVVAVALGALSFGVVLARGRSKGRA